MSEDVNPSRSSASERSYCGERCRILQLAATSSADKQPDIQAGCGGASRGGEIRWPSTFGRPECNRGSEPRPGADIETYPEVHRPEASQRPEAQHRAAADETAVGLHHNQRGLSGRTVG